jgi:hypothetical protein
MNMAVRNSNPKFLAIGYWLYVVKWEMFYRAQHLFGAQLNYVEIRHSNDRNFCVLQLFISYRRERQ